MRPIYKVDFKRLATLLLPIDLRQMRFMAWLRTLLAPVMELQFAFNNFRARKFTELEINGQVCYLQKLLNDKFDIENRRIYIGDANKFQRLYIYTREENKPLDLYTRAENKPIYLFLKEDFSDTGYDFFVNLNGAVLLQEEIEQMKILLNKYKLTTKKYAIR